MEAEWRRWIAENVLLGKDPRSIIGAMVGAGIQPAAAAAEVNTALRHPYIVAARQQTGTRPGNVVGPALESKLKKRDWVLECCRKAASVSESYGTVPRVRNLSLRSFLDDFYALNRPVIIEGEVDEWRAFDAWTPDELKRRFGTRIVEVQASRTSDANYERNAATLKRQMPFGEYVDIVESVEQSNEWYMTAMNSGINSAALAELWDDLQPTPEYLRSDMNNRGFFWYGPAGTITPLHHDLTNNLMAQIRGSKAIKLISPFELPRLYNDRHCYSEVDPGKPDLERHPLFKDVAVVDVLLGPRDLLFLPVGWWHYVHQIETSITMTFTNFVADNDFYSFYANY